MNLRKVSLTASLLSVALLAGSAAHAQATRTWVSGVGDDVNPCSRTAPCKTFAGAISKTAAKGEIDAIDPGGFGAVTITKSITIDGAGTMASILGAGTNGIIINALSTDIVTIRNLSIEGAGTGLNGIRILAAKEVHIENCVIKGFINRGIIVENTANNVNLYVSNSSIHTMNGASTPAGNSGAILLRPTLTGAASALIAGSHLDQNTFGLRVENNARATMTDSTASGNATFGVHAITPGPGAASIILERVVLSNNTTGVQAESSGLASVRISETLITSNSTGLNPLTGGQILSWGNNRVAGNGTDGNPTGAVVLEK